MQTVPALYANPDGEDQEGKDDGSEAGSAMSDNSDAEITAETDDNVFIPQDLNTSWNLP